MPINMVGFGAAVNKRFTWRQQICLAVLAGYSNSSALVMGNRDCSTSGISDIENSSFGA
jgi:hypothetical protein